MEYLAHINEAGQGQTIQAHSEGTARRAKSFANLFHAAEWGEAAGLIHDIGKYSEAFQKRIRDPEHTAKVDHSTAGAKEAAKTLPLAFVVAGHHSGLPDGGHPRTDSLNSPTLFGRLKRNIEDYSGWKKEKPQRLPIPPGCGRPLADYFFIKMLYSCLVDADYLDTEQFMQGEKPRSDGASIPELLRMLHTRKTDMWLMSEPKTDIGEARNSVLRQCIEHGKQLPTGLYTLTVPTGGGKTIASLSFALEQACTIGKSRVIYVIPYTSIIDQTAEEFAKIFGEENVLAHYSGSEYQLKESGELSMVEYKSALASENWDAPLVVTTAVQFFESLYGNKSSKCRKLHNIAQSVLIFDEAQTMPIPYLKPCVAAIAQLVQNYGCTAVLCTATQPELGELFHQVAPELKISEIYTESTKLYETLQRTVVRDLGTIKQDTLEQKLLDCKQALCVVNRRKTAQQFFDTLPENGRYCLTTLLCAADRRKYFQEIRERLKNHQPCRVISTSLIEAGVDLDFPVAFREYSGLDSILQTAGRCNREGMRPAQESFVWAFKLEEIPIPAMIRQNADALEETWAACTERNSSQAISRYFQQLLEYKGEAALDKCGILWQIERGEGEGGILPFKTIAEQFRLIDSPTRTIYIPIGEGAGLCSRLLRGERSRTLFQRLGQYSVNVYRNHFDALYHAGALSVLDEETAVLTDLSKYDPETGLEMDNETGIAFFL